MKIIYDSKEKSVITVEKGEEFFTTMNAFAKERDTSFTFSVIGGCDFVDIAYYDLDAKKYITKEFIDRNTEIITMTGNVAWYEGEPLIHTHGVFGNREYQCFGGHVMKLMISATAEVAISWLDKKLQKEFNEETGLKFYCGYI